MGNPGVSDVQYVVTSHGPQTAGKQAGQFRINAKVLYEGRKSSLLFPFSFTRRIPICDGDENDSAK